MSVTPIDRVLSGSGMGVNPWDADAPINYSAGGIRKNATYSDAERASYRNGRASARKKKGKKKTYRRKTYVRRSGQGPMPVYNGQRIVGYGSYFGDVGEGLGRSAGGYLGRAGGDLLSSITGMGAYSVNRNALMEGQIPAIYNKSGSGETVIRHREFLQDVISSPVANTFLVNNYNINAGLENTFPFLSQLAANYEQYRLEGMIFEFKSMSADSLNSVNTALGTVIMATNYNAGSANFSTKIEMENYEYGSSGRPSSSMMHPIECARSQTSIDELYVRTGTVPSGQDIRLYDIGNFQIATTGMQGTNVNVGELWVTYQVALLKPKMYVSLGDANLMYTAINLNYSNASPFGTGTLSVGYSNFLVTFASTVSSGALSTYTEGLYFPDSSIPQTYFVMIAWSGSGAVVEAYPNFAGCGLTRTDPYQTAPEAGKTSDTIIYTMWVRTLGRKGIQKNTAGTLTGTIPGAFIAVSNTGATLPTTPVGVYYTILQTPNNVLPDAYFGPIP